MNILVVGKRQGLAALLHALSEQSFQGITHLADGTQAIAELSQGIRRYNWVILEDQAIQGGGMDAAAVVRAMGSSSDAPPGGAIPGKQQWSRSHAVQPRRCGVEWDNKGVLQLRCCLQQTLMEGRPDRLHELTPGFIFEYHAPCRK
ncbi:MAG: hypothetical protein ACE5ET_01460 [Gammaproteobacteria bacterium]